MLKKVLWKKKDAVYKMFWGLTVLCSAVCENCMLPNGTKQGNVRLESVHITAVLIPNIINSL